MDGWRIASNLSALRDRHTNTNLSGRQKPPLFIPSRAINIDSVELALKVVTIRWGEGNQALRVGPLSRRISTRD